ncbi:MAG: hypothetical protein ACI35S_01220 [Anaeroplasma sp.]
MKINIAVFCILALCYIATIVITIIKIKDIHKNPEKYEHQDLIDETNRKYAGKWDSYCGFFKSLSHQYAMITIVFILIFVVIGTLIIIGVNKLNNAGEGSIFLGTQFIGSIGLLFLGMPLCMSIIPLSIKRPFFVVTTYDMFNTEYRPKIYFKGYSLFLIMFFISFPFIVLSCNNYAYYDDNGIYYNRFFQIEEVFTSYEEIEKIEIYVSYEKGKISELNYDIYLNNGKLDVNSANIRRKMFSENTIAIHEYIMEKGDCEFAITPLTEEEIEFFTNTYSNEDCINIFGIFNID